MNKRQDVFSRLGGINRALREKLDGIQVDITDIVCELIEAAYEAKQDRDELLTQITNLAFQVSVREAEVRALQKKLAATTSMGAL